VYTLDDGHKLYTSQLIAVMVKEEKAKKQQKLGKEEKAKKSKLFNITSFTRIRNRKKEVTTV
jgi:hypothetical protein